MTKLIFNYNLLNWYKHFNMIKEVLHIYIYIYIYIGIEINLDYSRKFESTKLIFNYNLLNGYRYFNMIKEILPLAPSLLVPFKEKNHDILKSK